MLSRILHALLARTPWSSPTAPVSRSDAITAAQSADQALAAGDCSAAIALYEKALSRDPGLLDARLNLGMACAMCGDLDQAARHFETLLTLAPDSAPAHMNLGNIALTRGHLGEAVRHYRAAQASSPADPGLLNNLGIGLQRQGLPEAAMDCFRAVLQAQPDHADAADNLLFAMQHAPSVSPEALFQAFQDWSRIHEQPLLPLQQPHANPRDPQRRLRIGYVSGDFFTHAVANFIEPVLASHDRGEFEVWCYYTRHHTDERTARLRGLADAWRDIAGMSDDEAAARVRADGMDILVDLSGHTTGNRLGVFARKPAPLQITWLGYPATTGMQSIDYRISDAVADPPGIAERFHSERLLRLPRSQWCYRPPPALQAAGPLPALARGHIMFGSFNNPAKLNDYILSVWAGVLRALPHSAITISSVSDPDTRHRISETLLQHGAQAGQVRVLGRLDDAEFWRIRDEIDVVLDSFPYNGTTTTCEALWAGLPVVTLAGTHGASRNCASLLTAAGLPQLIAQDAGQFVRIACELVRDLHFLSTLRLGMRERIMAHGLCDGMRFTRELEAAYRLAWQDTCRQAPARTQPAD